jgi:hypothetical protein
MNQVKKMVRAGTKRSAPYAIATMWLGVLAGTTSSQAQTSNWERCMNVAKVAHSFAQQRDTGVSFEAFSARLAEARKSGKLGEEDFMVAFGIAGIVFRDDKRLSPEQIRKQFARHCE